ncbi:MAG: hypothetical protein KBS60_03710 [Phascolarctobacterium sp.]|nr:hypothetical protein [Candidatus Phascolarctobacterium caballi]
MSKKTTIDEIDIDEVPPEIRRRLEAGETVVFFSENYNEEQKNLSKDKNDVDYGKIAKAGLHILKWWLEED